MTQTIHIYCDESCHLENDGMQAMVLGALWCWPSAKLRKGRGSICSKPPIACEAARCRNSEKRGTHGRPPQKTETPAHCCARASDTPSTLGR